MEPAIVQEHAPVLSLPPSGAGHRWGVLLLEGGGYRAASIARALADHGLPAEVRGVRTEQAFRQALEWQGLEAVLAATGNGSIGVEAALALARRWRPQVPFIALADFLAGDHSSIGGRIPASTEAGLLQAALASAVRPAPDYQDRLKALSARLLASQEEERHRIAGELHDEIGQALTTIKLHIQAAQRLSRGPASGELAAGLAVADQVLQQVRSLCLELRPPQLDHLGLVAALRWHIDRQALAGGLVASLVAPALPARLVPELETACYRIAQEAITNVLRHAGAHTFKVILEVWDDLLSLRIEDDGRGFDAGVVQAQALVCGGSGLFGMEERASLAGGVLEIDSAPGQGTRIKAVLPLRYRPGPGH